MFSKIELALAAVGAALVPGLVLGQDAVDLRLVGHDDLQARSAYQPVVHAYGERRILFVGHHAGEAPNPQTGKVEKNGLSIVDVTNPAAPEPRDRGRPRVRDRRGHRGEGQRASWHRR